MRVRIAYTVSVSDEYRIAIRRYQNRKGMATRAEVKIWMEEYGTYLDDDIMELVTDRHPFGDPED